ncbi:MAG: anaerobic ribonucleoside-triphosphate reductase activating protein [Bacillota bacterium]
MNIGGFVKTSFVDYPGEISSVIFTRGCNMNCYYCHNRSLINTNNNMKDIAVREVFHWLKKRKGIVNAAVVSGGEPTLQRYLYDFIKQLRAMGLRIKLDTNGTNPKVLKELIQNRLLDFIAMDLKAPLVKYRNICGVDDLNLDVIKESVEIIKNSGITYEFRTTMCRQLEVEDLKSIVSDFQIQASYVLQKCRSIENDYSDKGSKKPDIFIQGLQTGLSISYRGYQ